MASGQEAIPVEPLQHKTITLKTSIHCPGCSRKVKRIIQSIPGVHNFAIDPSQNKVSITGDAEADVIIKKFLKSNKQVALWPEKKKPTAANTTTSSKEISTSNDLSEKKKPDATAATDDKKTVDVAQEAASKPDVGPEKSPGPKSQRESVVPGKDDSNKKSENQEAKGSGDGDGDGDEKKEKIVQREISGGDRAVVDASDAEGMASLPLPPPQQQQQQQPQITMHQTPTAAAYVMSYNMAQPSTAHSYYAFPPPPPLPSQGHFYSSYAPPPPPPPPEFYYGMPSEWGSPAPPPESYHMFNDENANSCNVM